MNVITSLVGDKRRYRDFRARTRRLPASYRAAVPALERHLYVFGPSTADGVAETLERLADRLEAGAAAGTPIATLVGPDPVAFADGLVRDQPAGGWVNRERRRLASAIGRADALDPQGPARADGGSR